MTEKTRALLAVLLAAAWVNASEFLRNEWLLKDHWLRHYQRLGLAFPEAPHNGAIWGLWGLLFAAWIYALTRAHSWLRTALLAWFGGFVLMWLVIGNLGVLPVSLLPYALPLSLLETGIASAICRRVAPPRRADA